MNYKIIKDSENIPIAISLRLAEDRRKSFAIDNSNPHYISFLRQLSEENPNDPHYLAWVEAGNTPEDFWTQDEELIEPSVSEPSEPKEEEETTEGES